MALIVGQLQLGGAERQLYELAVRLERERWRPLVICLSEVEEPFGPRLRDRGIPVVIVPRSGHADPRRVRRLADTLIDHRIALSHSYLLAANAYTWAASWLAGRRPFVASSRTCIPAAGWLSNRIHRKAFRSAECVIANARRVKEFTCREYALEPSRVRVVPNGVDGAMFAADPASRIAVRRELGIAQDEFVAGTVARVSAEKNLDLLVDVAAAIAPDGAGPLRIVIAGEGPGLAALRERVASGGLGRTIMLTGACHDVPRMLASFDVFVQTSSTEGLPNAVMEAMAAGLPVVATRVGGTEEVVQEGVTGFLIEPEEPRIVEAIASRLHDLAQNRQTAAGLGSAARARIAAEFSMTRMVDETISVYEASMRGRR